MREANKPEVGEQGTEEPSTPGSETERFRAIVDVRHNEAVTGESGVPENQRDHELRCNDRARHCGIHVADHEHQVRLFPETHLFEFLLTSPG